jgi:hypothetical protein
MLGHAEAASTGTQRVGKSFVVVFTNGDLPKNPMSLRECVVCTGEYSPVTSRGRIPKPRASRRWHNPLPPQQVGNC